MSGFNPLPYLSILRLSHIFLDIELGTTSGIDTGKKLRSNFRNLLTQIIYISNHKQYAMELFQVHPFDFLLKPLKYKDVEKTIKNIINIVFKQNDSFQYKVAHKIYEIELYKILYFEKHRRKINIKTFEDNLEKDSFYGKISDISEQLLKLDFFLVSAYHLVNYHAVTEFEYKKVKLVNGEEISIGQAFRNDVRDMHMVKEVKNNDGTISIF